MKYIRFFNDISIGDVGLVGGKNANLGEMYSNLSRLEIKVPYGFALTAQAYKEYISKNNLKDEIKAALKDLDIADIGKLAATGKSIKESIAKGVMPKEIEEEISVAYKELSRFYKKDNVDVAVRSSATAEDLPDASFAGQQESYLNVNDLDMLLGSIKSCFASLFNERAISYRQSRGYDHFDVALSVAVQKMVRSDKACSGVMFTIDTESGSKELLTINSVWGLGENIVGGKVNPDEFYVFKPTLKEGKESILKRELSDQPIKMIYGENEDATQNILTTDDEQENFSLSDAEVIKLAKQGVIIEEYYSKAANGYRPMDIEWAKDGDDGNIYIVQARPETVHSKKFNEQDSLIIEKYKLKEEDQNLNIVAKGRAIGEKIGCGKVRVIDNIANAHNFVEGEVLVADNTDPDWEPVMKKASAVITNRGGRTCHAAIVAREIGVPAVVGCGNATQALKEIDTVTVSCSEGEDGFVYEGEIGFEIEKIDLKGLKEPKTKLFMNVADPTKAFGFAKLPNSGVGLARMEFIINNYIKAHPMALYDMQNGNSVEDEDKIKEIMKGFDDPKSFFINRLSEGVGMIAAAFYPKPVIVRTSDFKSNEYKHMLGGAAYEKDEENPMIGFRGASRYYSKEYKEAFIWECEALKKIRDEMGLTNVKVMIPFVRTPVEGKKVIEVMNEAGLTQGVNGLEVYAMCELPSNVLFADEFLKVFDGYSIGSNDLTQLTLGVDRDSALIAHIFDERNIAVKRMIKIAIKSCKRKNKYIGICGQAPSDYPEITKFLVENKIDSISLNPDSLLKMCQLVVGLEESQ